MDAREYHDHECPAYKNEIWKNPLDHKMRVGRWKVPGAELSARGEVLTGDAVLHAARSIEQPKVRFPWLLLSLVGGIVAALLYSYG
jgi:hypothetical protein